jgi:hypothetical protein
MRLFRIHWRIQAKDLRAERKRMRFKLLCLSSIAVLCLVCAARFDAGAQQTSASKSSVYTATGGKRCRTIEYLKETGDLTQSCPGVAGYKLEVADSDSRMSITVVSPGGQKSPLDYWNVITHGFSSLGDKAEWRVQKVNGKITPVALIVRVNASENPETPEKTTSYLAVAKITASKTCVTDKIGPSATANEQARRAADSAATRPCLEEASQE